jgi:iron complex outermembrane recepter protein
VPSGQTDAPLTAADFQATAGQRNSDSLSRFTSVIPEACRLSAAAYAQADVTSKLSAVGELLYVRNRTVSHFRPATLKGAIVPAENPFNPFGTAVAVDYLFTEIGPRQLPAESGLLRAAMGVNAKLGAWRWESSLLHSVEDGSLSRENDIDVDAVRAALDASDPSHALNVFESASGAASLSTGSLLAEAATTSYSSSGTQALSMLHGPAFDLPAGSAELAVAGEWRRQRVRHRERAFRVSHDRQVSAASLQLQLPLASAAMDLAGMTELSLTAAARLDQYNDSGERFNPQYGLDWRPWPRLLFQVSYGTSFRPQSQFDLYLEKVRLTEQVRDPRRNNEVVDVEVVLGGNPELAPVESRAFSAGLSYAPEAADPMLIRASYWRVDVQRGVSIVYPALILASEQRFADRVTRAEPTVADIAAGVPGRLQSVDASRMSLASIDARGVNVEISYALERGNPDVQLARCLRDRVRLSCPIGRAPEMARINQGPPP